MSTNRKRGVNSKSTIKSDQASKGPGKVVGEQDDGDSLSETGNNEQKVRKVGRPRKYPVGTPAASGSNPGTTLGKGSSSGTSDANKKSSSGTSDSPKKVPKVKKPLSTESKKKNINKRGIAIENTSKKALEKLEKAKAKAKLLELNKKKQLGVGKGVNKKKTVTKVKKAVSTKKNAKDAQAKLKSKSGAASGTMSSSLSSSSSAAKETKTSKAKKLAQNVETSENNSSKKTKKLAAKKVKLKKLATNVKRKILDSDKKKKKKKKKAVLVDGKVAKAKKLSPGSQAGSVSKQKASKKSGGQAASVSNNSADDQKKGTVSLKKKTGPVKGSKRPVQKVSALSKVSKSLADKVQKIKGKSITKIEKAKKRKEAGDPDLDVSATSNKRKKMDSVDAKQPAVKKSKITDQRSEILVKASPKVSTVDTLNKSALGEGKSNVSDKVPSSLVSNSSDTKLTEKELADISLLPKNPSLSKGSSQEDPLVDPLGETRNEQKIQCASYKDRLTVPFINDSKKVTTFSEAESKQLSAPCAAGRKQETYPCMDSVQDIALCTEKSVKEIAPYTEKSIQETSLSMEKSIHKSTPCLEKSTLETAPFMEKSTQETVSHTEKSVQETDPCTEKCVQETTPCMVKSVQETGPCMEKSVQETGPCMEKSVQETGPCMEKSVQETGPCTEKSVQETGPCMEKSVQETGPCMEKSVQETDPCMEKSVWETGPCKENRVQGTTLCTEKSVQEIAPCMEKSVQEIAPCKEKSVQKTASCTEKSVRETSPCTEKSVQDTVPCTEKSVQDTVPCTEKSVQDTVPCTEKSVQDTVPCTEKSVQDTVPCTEKSVQDTVPCTEKSVQDTVPCTEKSVQETSPSAEKSVRETAPCTEKSVREIAPCTEKSVLETAPCAEKSVREMAPCAEKSVRETAPCAEKSVQETAPCAEKSVRETAPCTEKSVRETAPCAEKSVRETAPCTEKSVREMASCTKSVQETAPCAEKSVRETAPCSEKIVQETTPCAEKSVQETAPCTEKSVQETAPCTEKSVRETAPCTEKSVRETAPCAEKSVRETAPCAEKSVRETAPCTEKSVQETAPCTEKSVQETAPCTERSEQKSAPCAAKSVRETLSCNIESRREVVASSVDNGQETASCVVECKAVPSASLKDNEEVAVTYKVDHKQMAPCNVDSAQEVVSCIIDEKFNKNNTTDDKQVHLPSTVNSVQESVTCTIKSELLTVSCTIGDREVSAPCKLYDEQKSTTHTVDVGEASTPRKVDVEEALTPHTVDVRHKSVLCAAKNEHKLDPCRVDDGDVSTPCTFNSGEVSNPCILDSKQKPSSCIANKQLLTPFTNASNMFVSQQVSKSCEDGSKDTSQELSVEFADKTSKSENTSVSASSKYANTTSPLVNRLSSFMDSKPVIGFNQTVSVGADMTQPDYKEAVHTKQKTVNIPSSENSKYTCSSVQNEMTNLLSDKTVDTKEKQDKVNVFKSEPKLHLDLDNSEPKVFNSLDKLKNSDTDLALKKSKVCITTTHPQKNLVPNLLPFPQVKTVVSGMDSQVGVSSKKNETEACAENTSNNEAFISEAGDGPIVNKLKSSNFVQLEAQKRILQEDVKNTLEIPATDFTNEITVLKQKDSSSAGKGISVSEKRPALESSKEILPKTNPERLQDNKQTNSASIIPKTSPDLLSDDYKLPETNPDKDLKNLPQNFQEHNSVDSHIEQSNQLCDAISSSKPQTVLSAENISKESSLTTAVNTSASKIVSPLIAVNKLASHELIALPEGTTPSKSMPVLASSLTCPESLVVPSVSTEQRVSTVASDKMGVSNLIQQVSSKDKNIFASFSDLDPSLCEKKTRSVIKMAPKVEPTLPEVYPQRTPLPLLTNRPSSFSLMESLSTSSVNVTQRTNVTSPSSSSSPLTKVSLSTSLSSSSSSSSSTSATNALKTSHTDLPNEDTSSFPEPTALSMTASEISSTSFSFQNDITTKTFSKETSNFLHKSLVANNLLSKPAEVTSTKSNQHESTITLVSGNSTLASKGTFPTQKEENTFSQLDDQGNSTEVSVTVKDPCPNIFSKLDDLMSSKVPGKKSGLQELQPTVSKEKDKVSISKSINQNVSPENKKTSVSVKSDKQDVDSLSPCCLEVHIPHAKDSDTDVILSGSKSQELTSIDVFPSTEKSVNDSLNTKASLGIKNDNSDTESKTSGVNLALKSQSESENKGHEPGTSSIDECTDSTLTTNIERESYKQTVSDQIKTPEIIKAETKEAASSPRDFSTNPEQSSTVDKSFAVETETSLPTLKFDPQAQSSMTSQLGTEMQNLDAVKTSNHSKTEMKAIEKSASVTMDNAVSASIKDDSQSILTNDKEEFSSKGPSPKVEEEMGLMQANSLLTMATKSNLTEGCAEKIDKKEEISAESNGTIPVSHVTAKPFVAPIAQETTVDVDISKDEENSFSDKKEKLLQPSKNLENGMNAGAESTKLESLSLTTSDSTKASVDVALSSKEGDDKKSQQLLLVEAPVKPVDITDKSPVSSDLNISSSNENKTMSADPVSDIESKETSSIQVVDSSQVLSPEVKDKADNKDQPTTSNKESEHLEKPNSQLVEPVSTSSNTEICTAKSSEKVTETIRGEKVLPTENKLNTASVLEPPPTPYPPPYLSPKHSQDSAGEKQATQQDEVQKSSSPSSEIARSKVVTWPSFVVLDSCFVCVICCQMCHSKRVFQAHIWWHFHVRSKLCNHCTNTPQNADNNVGLQSRPNKCPYVLDVMLKICRARKKMHRSIVQSDADQSNREKTFAEDETDTESVDLDYELDNGGGGGGGDSFSGKSTDQSLLSPPRGQDVTQSEKENKSYADLTDDSNSIFAPANVDYLRSLYSSGSKKRTKKSSSASNAQNHHHHRHHRRHHRRSSSSSSSSSTSSPMVTSSTSAAAQKKGSFYVCGFQYCTYSCMNCLQFRLHLQQCHNFETVFPCYHCGQTNYSKDDLIKHMYNHSNARDFLLFRCSFPRCRFGTNMLQEFHEHNNIFHVGELVFTCFYCSTEFSELSQLLAHLQSNLLKFVQCPHCTVKDRNRRTVLNHISTEHPLKPKQIVVTSQVVCKKKQTVTPDQNSEVSQHQQQVNLHRSLSEDRILECIKCGLLCRNIATLRKHSRVCLKDALSHKKSFVLSPKENHWTLVYSCQWCSFPASSDTMLFQHTVDQHPGKNANFEQIELKISGSSGSGCNSRLPTSSWLEAAKSGAFICPYCKVAFHNERNWSEHMEREHNGDEHDISSKKGLDSEKKYPCDFCEFNGTSEQDLHEHQQIMTATEGPEGVHRKVVDLANITPKVTLLTDTKLTVSNVLSFKRFKRSPSKKMNNAYFKCSGCHFRSLSKWQSLRHVKHCSLAKRRLSEYIRRRNSMGNGSADDIKIEPIDIDTKPLEIEEEPLLLTSPSSDRPKTDLEDPETHTEWGARMMSYMRDKQMNLMAKEGILDCTDSEGYRCSICRHTGKTMINIRQHLWKTHLKLKPVNCPCCPFTSWKNYTLEKHKISKHHHSHPNLSDYEMKTLAQNLQGTADGIIECQLCFYKSPSSYKVRTHIWRTHMHLEMKQCSLCAYKCWYLYLMNMHQLSRHKPDQLGTIDGKPHKAEIDVNDNEDDNGSKLTEAAAENISNVIGDSSTMSDEDMSLSAKGLMEKKSGNKIMCCVCQYECTRIMIMKIHIWKRHLNIKQRRCPQCPYICWLQSRLEQHVCRIKMSGSSKTDDNCPNIEASTLSTKEGKSRWVISKTDEFGCKLYINKSKCPQKRLSMDESGQPTPKKFRSMSDSGTVTNSGGGGGGGRGATTTTNFSKGSKNFSWIRHTWENSVTQSFFRVGCRKLFARTTDRLNQMEIFTCVYCSYKSWNMEAMCHHSYKHKLQCGYCLFRAYSRKKILEHIEEFHQAPPKIIRDENYKKYRMIFPSLGASRDKMRSKVSTERQRRRRRINSSARSSSNVINLDDSEESDLDSESTSDWRPSSDSEDDQEEEMEERVTRYCCCYCSMRSHDFDRFCKHVAKHSRSAEELQCPTCVYRTRDAYKFHQHIRRHPSEHFCGYCNFSSMQESFVQLHVRRVHPKKPVQIHVRSQTLTAATAANGGRTLSTSSVTAANFNVRIVLQDFLALDTVEFESMLKMNVIHSLDLENIILEEDKLLSVL